MLSCSAMLRRTRVLIPRRFCGPPDSGNGGYSSGLVANTLGKAAECTLRKPIPIETELSIEKRDDGAVLLDEGTVIIECRPAAIDVELHGPPALKEAEAAAGHSPAFHNHPFPTCFVCGPQRAQGDGMRIFPGKVGNKQELWGATWTPDASLADSDGEIKPEFVWAAMDCPTGFAAGFPWAGKLVTGRLAVRQEERVRCGEPHIIVSWPLGIEGRKHHAGAALYTAKGRLCAAARATWIKIG